MIKWIGKRLARLKYVRLAIEDEADLSAFEGRPRPLVIVGLILIVGSAPFGWPAVLLLAVLAAAYEAPLLLAIGGPAVYAFSYLVFFVGLYLAGRDYARAFMRWATRRAVLKMLGESPRSEESS